MENNTNKRGMQDYTVNFNASIDLEEVKALYADREANSQRIVVDTILMDENDILTQEEIKNIPLNQNAFPAVESKLWFKVKDMFYPLSDKGISSNGNRIQLTGNGLFLMENALLKKIVLDIYSKLQGKDRVIKIIIIDDMVRAIMSADYRIIPILDVLNILDEYLKNRFNGFSFDGGFSTYDKISLMFKFPKTEEIPLMYGKKTTWTSGLKFESSDTGISSNIVKACWYTENGRIVFDDVSGRVRLIHKGTNDLDMFEKSLETLFIKLHDRAKYIQIQASQHVEDPNQFIDLITDVEESPIINKTAFKQLFGKKDIKALQTAMDAKRISLKEEYNAYIALLDEDEEVPPFSISVYDVINVFLAHQGNIKAEKKERLEYFCGIMLISDFSKIV